MPGAAALLADEPTGNLDPATAEGIHALLADLNAKMGITAVVVTHNERLASALPRRLRLGSGGSREAVRRRAGRRRGRNEDV